MLSVLVPVVLSARVEGSQTSSGFLKMCRLHLRGLRYRTCTGAVTLEAVRRLYVAASPSHHVSCIFKDTDVVRLPPDTRDSHQTTMNLALSVCWLFEKFKNQTLYCTTCCLLVTVFVLQLTGKGTRRATLALTTRLQ